MQSVEVVVLTRTYRKHCFQFWFSTAAGIDNDAVLPIMNPSSTSNVVTHVINVPKFVATNTPASVAASVWITIGLVLILSRKCIPDETHTDS